MAITDLLVLAITALASASRAEATNLLVRGINEAGEDLSILAGGKTVVSIHSGSSSDYNRLYNDSAVVRFKASEVSVDMPVDFVPSSQQDNSGRSARLTVFCTQLYEHTPLPGLPQGALVFRASLPSAFPALPGDPMPGAQRYAQCLILPDLGAPAFDGSAENDDGSIGGGDSLAPATSGSSKRRHQSGLSDPSLALSRDGMDTVRVRVLNAFPASKAVAFRSVSSDCYQCALPLSGQSMLSVLERGGVTVGGDPIWPAHEMGAPPAQSLGQGYLRLDAKHPIVLAASAEYSYTEAQPHIPRGHPSVILRQAVAFEEHQAITIVIGAAARNGSVRAPDNDWKARPTPKEVKNGQEIGLGVVVLSDSKGNNTWIPLAWGLLGVVMGLLCAYLFQSVSMRTICQQGDGDGDDGAPCGGLCCLCSPSKPGAADRRLDDQSAEVGRGGAGSDNGRRYKDSTGRELNVGAAGASGSSPAPGSKPGRVHSVDALRGIALSIMIFVNYGGGGYWWLDHSRWDGLTVADLVFPVFVWTMGASMALSMAALRRKGKVGWTAFTKIAWRAAKLAAVGLFLNNGTSLQEWRVPGVLQYFAIAAFFVGMLYNLMPLCTFGGCGETAAMLEGSSSAGGSSSQKRGNDVRRGDTAVNAQGLSQPLMGDEDGSSDRPRGFDPSSDPFGRESSSAGWEADLRSGSVPPVVEGRDAYAVAAQEAEKKARVEAGWQGAAYVCGDVWPYTSELLFVAGMLTLYLCVYQLVAPSDVYKAAAEGTESRGVLEGMKDCPVGYIGAGGLSEDAQYFNCSGGVHRAVDMLIFGPRHVYHNTGPAPGNEPVSAATCADTYFCPVYDPEGLLGACMAVVMAWVGLQAGRILIAHRPTKSATAQAASDTILHPEEEDQGRGLWELVLRLAVWGAIIGGVGTALAGGAQFGGALPLCKNVWSPSFIFVMAGVAFMSLGLLWLVCDYFQLWRGAPFTYLGQNSIVIYAGSEIFYQFFPFTITMALPTEYPDGFRSHSEALAANIIGVMCWMVIGWYMHRYRWFVRL